MPEYEPRRTHLQLAREAGFEDLDEVADVLERARLGLDEYAELYGREVGAGVVAGVPRGPEGRFASALGRKRREAAELERRKDRLEESVQKAYARGWDVRAEQLEVALDEVYDQLDAIAMVLEEGGEEQTVGEQSRGDEFEAGLASLYYMATQHPMYSRDPEQADGSVLQSFVRNETGRRVSRERALEMGRRAFEAKEARLARMRERLRQSEGRVPEHVRVEHELARMRAARVPPELAAALGYEPLRPNARMHPVVEATLESLHEGVRPARSLGVPLSAGLPLVLSRRVVRECQLWIETFYSS